MFDELNRAVQEYQTKWQAFVAERQNREFFERLKPTAVGWKVTDVAEYDKLLREWRDGCDLITEVYMNERWIALLHLKDTKLPGDVEIIKLMQRRPNSSDPVGLDHVDFLDMEETNTKAVLAEEKDIKWTDEQRSEHDAWVSLWFDNTEAKLRPNTVLDKCIGTIEMANRTIRGDKFIAASDQTGAHIMEIE